MSNPVRVVDPVTLPVTLAETKQHLRVDHTDDDAMIQLYLDAAINHLDGASGWLARALVEQTWAETFSSFARCLRLAVAPVAAIVSVIYLDADAVEQTVSPDEYSLSGAELVFDTDYAFPTINAEPNSLTVTYEAGEAIAPAAVRAAILLMVGDMYANREGKTDGGLIVNPTVRMLLNPFRRGWAA